MMKLGFSSVRAVMGHRLLINYRVRLEQLQPLLPSPFRPLEIDGWGMAGICLIRLERSRPKAWPGFLGLTSENAAHRIAVRWTEAGCKREGVFIPRRDTNSRINHWVGGRWFPGFHQLANIQTRSGDGQYEWRLSSPDHRGDVHVKAHTIETWPAESVLALPNRAVEFFRAGGTGWSREMGDQAFEGVELRMAECHLQPLQVDDLSSSFFDDHQRFPAGAIALDSAFLMRDVPHSWHTVRKSLTGRATRNHRGHGSSAMFEFP